jgi:hypothetical protein
LRRAKLSTIKGSSVPGRRRRGWAGHIIRMEEQRIPKKVLTETSILQDQWEDQEPDGWMWFREMLENCWG